VSVRPGQCGHNGGQGIGAGHVCECVRAAGHPLDSDRPHGCTCMALWADKGVEPPTPRRAPLVDAVAILELLEAHTQSARNNRCSCGWRPENASIMNPPSAQHRVHLSELLAEAFQ